MSVPSLTKYGPCAALFLVLLLAPPLFSWLSALFSPNQLVLDLHGMELPALYKKALLNSDGSIDLTINIPASADVLRRLQDRQQHIRYNLTLHSRQANVSSAQHNQDPDPPKTYYPLTLDSPYVLNSPAICRGVYPLHVLVIVHTSTTNFQRRRLIRETWAGPHVMTTRNLRVLFVLGLTANSTAQAMIENERAVYGDLIQGKFKDTYHNLTHKGVLAYRWIHQHCSHARLVLKVDDDVFINPFLFYEVYYPRFSRANRTIACHVRPKNTSPIVRQKSKWTVQEYEFRGYKYYPFPYCNGYMVVITPDIIKAMYKAAYTTPFFWVDDVYLYGMLAAKVGHVKHVDIHKNLTLKMETGLKCYRQLNCTLLATNVWKESSLHEVWRLSITQLTARLRPHINPVFLVT